MQKKPVILTPNRRLARHLQKQASEKLKKNNTVWQTLEILPLSSWLTNLWLESQEPQRLLSPNQERLLWHSIIAKTEFGLENFIDDVIDANNIITHWQIEENLLLNHLSENTATFLQLRKNFLEHCQEQNFTTTSKLPTSISPYLKNQDQDIAFAGFDEHTPQMLNFFDAIKNPRRQITHIDPNKFKNSTITRCSFDNQEEELVTAARFAYQVLQDDPKKNVCFVVPNLTQLRTQIDSIFTDVFDNQKLFNISAGVNLGSLPIIENVLFLLTLHDPFDARKFSKLLTSAYIAGADTEKSTRAFFDFCLNQTNKNYVYAKNLEFLAKKHEASLPTFIACIQKWQKITENIHNKNLHCSSWTKIFIEILSSFGWPGENNLSVGEHEAKNRFFKLLHEFTTMDAIVGKITYQRALKIIFDLAARTVFHPEKETDSQVNILGILEAGGLNFDYLWMLGLSDEAWPTHPNPNPFIPISVQRKFNLPHASPERELQFCQTLLNRFKRSASKIIFSHVKYIEERTVDPSSLIADIKETSLNDLKLGTFIPKITKIYQAGKLEILENDLAPELATCDVIHGGSKLIELQSLCPFRAFAEFRLSAQDFQIQEIGIKRQDRGTLIHMALENFWHEVKTHEKLCILDNFTELELLNNSIKIALDSLGLTPHLKHLEKKCLITLLSKWLAIEKTRAPFQVMALEKNIQTKLGPLQIKLRIDRIDQLADGNLLIIDYKSSKSLPVISDWFGNRPKNPQLPLYCVAVSTMHSFAFAQINIESIKFQNIETDELKNTLNLFDVQNPINCLDWHDLIGYWNNTLCTLATNFAKGEAKTEPLSTQVCQQCKLGLLCRFDKTEI